NSSLHVGSQHRSSCARSSRSLSTDLVRRISVVRRTPRKWGRQSRPCSSGVKGGRMNKTAPSGALSPNALAAMACVDAERLIRLQRTLANFGGREDGGVAREALTAVELDARRWLAQQVQGPQYSWHIDEAANLFL